MLEIPIDSADEVTRNFAYSCAVCGGYDPTDTCFWSAFMSPPMSESTWVAAGRTIALYHFADGIIRMPEDFLNWKFVRGHWVRTD